MIGMHILIHKTSIKIILLKAIGKKFEKTINKSNKIYAIINFITFLPCPRRKVIRHTMQKTMLPYTISFAENATTLISINRKNL